MLAALLRAHGAQVTTGGGTLVVGGMDAVRIGKVAVEHQIALSQLTDMTASLEEAYFRLTSDSVDYAAPQQEEDSAWQR
jgi:ABC-2 type transport system ATP-binding protein